jgi:PEGA domain
VPDRSRLRACTSVALVGILLTEASPSFAQPAPVTASADATATAASLKQEGNNAMAALRPADALVAYRRAYAILPEPALLYNIGHALEAIGDFPAALAEYEEFRRVAPAELKARVPRLDELITDMQGRVTVVTIHCNVPGARVLVRDIAVGQVGGSGVLSQPFASGPAKIEVLSEGYAPYTRQTTFERGKPSVFEVDLVSKAAAGVIAIDTAPVSGTVLVDGKVVGQAPVEDTVSGGTHRIVVRHDGYPDVETQAVAEIGQTKHFTINLEKSPLFLTRWWFWAGVGVVAAGTAAVLYAAYRSKSPDSGTIAPGQAQVPLGIRF